ncbi:50S ribosomal protein L23 [Helicobacter canis]|uniref:Large ribosomal subunit protein uL23 n=2 Tax=Helicobacter canis TaxID=29419 RepID=V8CIJ5_9HELI|nr:50S ribosomal protein L23 [Helicobacter canis]ETD26897.1 50S ribosomal protein L23 [Helicobacter canis NCTC 12740]KAA8708583.1 50S ribosomal protein L23 [Helicobacter canis]
MADITDIKSILYTEKSLSLQESGVLVVQTSTRVTKNQLKEVFREYFGVVPVKINSLRQDGKVKRSIKRGGNGSQKFYGQRSSYKKFYVKIPEGAKIDSLTA